MKILELFAGHRSIGKIADERGVECFSIDNNSSLPNLNLIADIENLQVSDLPFIPDVLWASTICTPFSIAGWFHHFELVKKPKRIFIPKSETAFKGILLAKKTLSLIDELLIINPNMKFYVENPRGLLRKMPFMSLDKNIKKRVTVTYCQYGGDFMKPTDIWTNDTEWLPRRICKAGAGCHISSPSSADAMKNLTTYYERSAIPRELVLEVIFKDYSNYPKPINDNLFSFPADRMGGSSV